jgi:hypothetical protein
MGADEAGRSREQHDLRFGIWHERPGRPVVL